jgi:hypothetical protein
LSKAAFHATPNLPACFNLEQMDPKKTAIGETAYLVSVQDGKTRFYFSNKNTLAPTDKKFFCVYKTKKPRCHALVGALRAMKPVRMKCKAERNRNAMCFDTIFNEQCTMDGTSICGNKKMTRDMLECCDKTSDDFGGNGCLTRRRRLNENLVITNKWKVDAIAGPKCAQRCVDRTGCRAFRLDAANRCELAIDCKASAGPLDGLYASREWMLLPGTQPYPPSRKRKRKSKK